MSAEGREPTEEEMRAALEEQMRNIRVEDVVLQTTATLINLAGRRVGLWWGAVGQGISLILAGVFARLLKDHPEKAAQYGGAAALFVFMYTFIFGATWLTIPWVYPTETFPLEVRAKGNAFGVFGWSIGASPSSIFPSLFPACGVAEKADGRCLVSRQATGG